MLYDPLLPKARFSFTTALENKQMDKAFSKNNDRECDLSSCFHRQITVNSGVQLFLET